VCSAPKASLSSRPSPTRAQPSRNRTRGAIDARQTPGAQSLIRPQATLPARQAGVFHPSRAVHALLQAFPDAIWIDESGLSTSDVRQWMQFPAGGIPDQRQRRHRLGTRCGQSASPLGQSQAPGGRDHRRRLGALCSRGAVDRRPSRRETAAGDTFQPALRDAQPSGGPVDGKSARPLHA